MGADVPLKEKEKIETTTATKADEIVAIPPKEQEKAETASDISEAKTDTKSDTSATTTTAEIMDIPDTKAEDIVIEEDKSLNEIKSANEEILKIVEPQISTTST